MEAYLEGPDGYAWAVSDPTRKSAAQVLVRIGIGRDAADVAFCSPLGEAAPDKPEVWIKPVEPAVGGIDDAGGPSGAALKGCTNPEAAAGVMQPMRAA